MFIGGGTKRHMRAMPKEDVAVRLRSGGTGERHPRIRSPARSAAVRRSGTGERSPRRCSPRTLGGGTKQLGCPAIEEII